MTGWTDEARQAAALAKSHHSRQIMRSGRGHGPVQMAHQKPDYTNGQMYKFISTGHAGRAFTGARGMRQDMTNKSYWAAYSSMMRAGAR